MNIYDINSLTKVLLMNKSETEFEKTVKDELRNFIESKITPL